MKYNIKWIEKKPTAAGKDKWNATLVSESGSEESNVAIWDNFPGFNDLRPGGTVSGDVVTKQNGQYTNKTLYPERTNTMTGNVKAPAWATKGPAKNAFMKEAQEKKQEGIKESQNRKDESVKTSGTMRDAVQIALAELGERKDHTDYENRILYWREWLVKNWGIEEAPF